MAYSSEETSSTMLMHKQSSSIKSSFDSLADGKWRNDCKISSTCDDEFEVLSILEGLSTITQSVGSDLLSSSSSSKIQFLISSSFNSESIKITANLLLKFVI